MHKKRILKNTSGVHASCRKPTKKCAMKMKQTNKEKKPQVPKIFFDREEEGVYKVGAENLCHGYQMISGQRS